MDGKLRVFLKFFEHPVEMTKEEIAEHRRGGLVDEERTATLGGTPQDPPAADPPAEPAEETTP